MAATNSAFFLAGQVVKEKLCGIPELGVLQPLVDRLPMATGVDGRAGRMSVGPLAFRYTRSTASVRCSSRAAKRCPYRIDIATAVEGAQPMMAASSTMDAPSAISTDTAV